MENKGNIRTTAQEDKKSSEEAVPAYDPAAETAAESNEPATDLNETEDRNSVDDTIGKGKPQPFEEGWKDQERFRAD